MGTDLAESPPGGGTARCTGEGDAAGAGEKAGGRTDTPAITFHGGGDLHRDMMYRLSDVGVCHLLEDARDGGGDLALVGKNIFRKGEKRPHIDEIIVPNTGLVEGLTRGA